MLTLSADEQTDVHRRCSTLFFCMQEAQKKSFAKENTVFNRKGAAPAPRELLKKLDQNFPCGLGLKFNPI